MRVLLLAAVAVSFAACASPASKPPLSEVASGDFPIVARPACEERLLAAARRSDGTAVGQLIAEGATPDCGDDLSPTLLSEAILYDRTDVVRALLKGGASPNLRWSSHGDRLPLQDVIEGGALFGMQQVHRAEILALLIRYGADVNARWCPFESRLALYRGEGAARTLVAPGCTASGGVTALRMASQLGQADSVAQLLAAGADVSWWDRSDRQCATALDVARSEDIFGLIVVHGFSGEADAIDDYRRRAALADGPQDDKSTGLLTAVGERAYGLARLLLAAGADPDEAGGNGVTPLQLAVVLNWREGAKLLLAFGADIEGRSCPSSEWLRHYGAQSADMAGCTPAKGLTPLMVAAATMIPVGVFGSDRSFGLLDSTAVDWKGRSARRYAALAGVPAKTLFNYGR